VGNGGKTQGMREEGNAGVQGGTTINLDFTNNALNNKKVSLIIGFISQLLNFKSMCFTKHLL